MKNLKDIKIKKFALPAKMMSASLDKKEDFKEKT